MACSLMLHVTLPIIDGKHISQECVGFDHVRYLWDGTSVMTKLYMRSNIAVNQI